MAPATVLVPVGGGGLVGGIAVALHELQPETRLVGVQAAGAAAFPPSLSAGVPVALASMATMADGIAAAQPGEHTFPIVRDLVDEVVTLGQEQISEALLLLLNGPRGSSSRLARSGSPRCSTAAWPQDWSRRWWWCSRGNQWFGPPQVNRHRWRADLRV